MVRLLVRARSDWPQARPRREDANVRIAMGAARKRSGEGDQAWGKSNVRMMSSVYQLGRGPPCGVCAGQAWDGMFIAAPWKPLAGVRPE
ncbi:hypothetical protein BI347_11760 [Chromobacterium sphagni]|uniref:Uncharacterized protein n=1 Tax=Chromobacterium sphagni TaxID=1903179 RepID=A0A1S1X3Q1_9NEIS|nr:hypothetical protein BI347_11760 [Chromobacterium sphagni]OHX20316.1 hypothetical protein BI344_07460 [Chromobacterium sphagni]